MLIRKAPIRFRVPSFSWAGPTRISSIVPVVLVLMRVPRGRVGWKVAIPHE